MGENDNIGRGKADGITHVEARLGCPCPPFPPPCPPFPPPCPPKPKPAPLPPDIARALIELTNFCLSNKASIDNNTQRIEVQTVRIDTEITERKAGEATLLAKISEEVAIERSAREQSEATNFDQLKRWISGEAETRKNAVDEIRNELAEIPLKIAVISDSIETEAEIRETKDEQLERSDTKIRNSVTEISNTVAANKSAFETAIVAEEKERRTADAELDESILKFKTEFNETKKALADAIEAEKQERIHIDNNLEAMIHHGGGGGGGDVTKAQLDEEIQARKDGDTRLANAIETETAERKEAYERMEHAVAEIRSTTEIVNSKTATEAKNFAKQFAEELFSREKTEREEAVNAVYSFITNAVAAALIEAKAYADAHGSGCSCEVTKEMFEKEVEDRIKGDSNTYERAVNTAKAYTDSQIGGGGGGDIDKDTPLPYLAIVGGDGNTYKQSVGIEDGEAVIKIDQITTVVDGQKTYNYVTLMGGDLKYYNLSVGIDESEVTQFLIETVNATDKSKAMPYMTFLGSDGNKYKLSVIVEDSEPTLDLSINES